MSRDLAYTGLRYGQINLQQKAASMGIGHRLRKERLRHGLTLGQVATYEGISPQYLSELERGAKQPTSWQLLAKLARRYDCSVDYLLGLTDNPTPSDS